MPKKVIGALILLVIILYVICLNLPISISCYSDIKLGNKIIGQIDAYKTTNGLPESGDWETLKKFSFEDNLTSLVPDYQKLDNETYELVFFEGFDGPHLLWSSKDREWKMGFPTLPDGWRQKNKAIVE